MVGVHNDEEEKLAGVGRQAADDLLRVTARLAAGDADDPLVGGHGQQLGVESWLDACLGAPLARLEARVAFEELLAAHPEMELAVATDTIEWRRSRAMRGVQALPVRLRRAS
jgi:hypothetical protein